MSDNTKDDLNLINKKLDRMEERLEEAHSEFSHQTGKSLGRDIGILYGIVLALLFVIIMLKFHLIWYNRGLLCLNLRKNKKYLIFMELK